MVVKVLFSAIPKPLMVEKDALFPTTPTLPLKMKTEAVNPASCSPANFNPVVCSPATGNTSTSNPAACNEFHMPVSIY